MTSENGYTKYLKAGRCVILAAMLNAYQSTAGTAEVTAAFVFFQDK